MVKMDLDSPQTDILIVDDAPEVREMLDEALAEQGYKVQLALGGQLALAVAQAASPGLILLDIMMPDMDGLEVCRQLKATPATRDIPVIFMTALDAPADKLRGFEAGGVDYIPKPPQVGEVLARVKLHLTLSRLQQQLEADNELLEQRVQARAAQLVEANQKLQAEIEQRIRHEREKDRLFDLTRQQSDQLRQLTTLLIQNQQSRRQAIVDTVQQHILPYLKLLGDSLHLMQQLATGGDPAYAMRLLAGHLSRTQDLLDHVQVALSEAPVDVDADDQALLGTPLLQLSARERQVLHLLVQGKSNVEIASLLVISAKTVSTHRVNVMQKLGAGSLADLVRLSIRR